MKKNLFISRRLVAVLPVFFILLAFSGCGYRSSRDWVMFRGEGGRGYSSDKIYPPVGIKWKLQLQEGSARERHFNPPVVYKNTLYFGSSDSNFYALDINTGFMRWVFKTRAPVNSVPYVDDEKVYFGSTDGYIYAVYHKSGDPAWEHFTGFPVNSTIIGYNDSIVFTTDTGATHFFSKEGVELSAVTNYVWEYNSFQINNGVVYFLPGPEDDPFSLGAYSIDENRFLWLFRTDEDGLSWYSFPAVSGDAVHFAACGVIGNQFLFEYYALDALTGEIIWKNTEVTDPVDYENYIAEDLFWENIYLLDYMAPAVWKDNVIYSPGNDSLKAFKSTTGELLWERKFDAPVSSAPSVAGNRIYLGTRGDKYLEINPSLKCIDAGSGKVLWEIDTDGEILSSPVIAGRWIIFGTGENYLYVLEELF